MKKDCRYKFSGSYCANKKISGERCHDHDACAHYSPPHDAPLLAIEAAPPENEGCEHRRCGVYCAKVQKFVCDGPENCVF